MPNWAREMAEHAEDAPRQSCRMGNFIVDSWYDRQSRNYITQLQCAGCGHHTLSAEYDGTKADRAVSKRDAEEAVRAFKTQAHGTWMFG